LDRKTSIKHYEVATQHLRKVGYRANEIGTYVLVGLPYQTQGDIYLTLDCVLLNGALPHFLPYSPIPGTKLWNTALEKKKYPIDREPLFQNRYLYPVSEDGINDEFVTSLIHKCYSLVGTVANTDLQNLTLTA
jgi:radical SAM superfamily enzyme YgiQ (UPF0313 family)